jgi:hypothetical protein
MAVRGASRHSEGAFRRVGSLLMAVCALAATTALTPCSVMSQERKPASFDHAAWDRILKDYVDENGLVAYERLGNADRAPLDAYLGRLADARPQDLGEQDRLAFWINAYNAGIVGAILRDYSPESMLSRAQLFGWYSFPVAGKGRTPNEVEHEILRKQFHEPRIHFALVCGATSCPKLRREAYRGDVLDQQLDDQARRFINDPQRNRLDDEKGARLSSIFEWFESDFAAAAGSMAEFVARYVDDSEQAEALKRSGVRIEFLDYDWTLNAQVEPEGKERGSALESIENRDKRVCAIGKRSAAAPAVGEPKSCTGEFNG